MPVNALRSLARSALLALLLFFSIAPAWAHKATRSLYDPQGREYAVRILEALEHARDNPSDPAVIQLVTANPNLARRSYAAIWDMLLDDVAASHQDLASQKSDRALLLAKLIAEKLDDPTPLKLQTEHAPLSQLIAYLDTLRPRLSQGYYFADRSHVDLIDPDEFHILRPLLKSYLRLDLARTLEKFSLLIDELDAAEPLLANVQAELKTTGKPPLSEDYLAFFRQTVEERRICALAEMGLLNQFDSHMSSLPVSAPHAAHLWLAGFRAAARQDRWDKAASYLRSARAAARTNDPVLEYALRTADHQVRYHDANHDSTTLTREQVFAEFNKAWSALDAYQPMTVIAWDYSWHDGKLATRQWIEELRPYQSSESYTRLRHAVSMQLSDWVGTPAQTRLGEDFSEGLQAIVHPDEMGALLSLVSGLNEQLIDWQDLGVEHQVQKLLGTAQLLEGSASLFFDRPNLQGGLLDQYRARALYLQGLLSNDPTRYVASATLAGQIENKPLAVTYLLNAAEKLDELGNVEQATTFAKQALPLAEKLSLPDSILRATSILARSYQRQKSWDEAALYADKALATLRPYAPYMGASGTRAQELAQLSREMTDISAQAALHAQRTSQALSTLNRGKELQTAALQMQGQPQARAEGQAVMAKEQQVAALGQQVDQLKSLPSSPTRDAMLADSQSLLADNRATFLTSTRTLRQQHPDLYTRVLKFDPLDLAQLQKSLPADLAVVQYFPTDETLYIFVVTAKEFRLRQVNVARPALESAVVSYLRGLRRAIQDDPGVNSSAEELYGLLIAPINDDLPPDSTLVLIPTGRLSSLPFASLLDPSGKPLVETHRLLELAKPGDLAPASPSAPAQSVVAFANATGDLPAAQKEGEQVAAIFGKAQLFEGKKATRDAFLQNGGHSEILHLATHGEWTMQDSLQNYLAMANNQKISQDEIFQLDLSQTAMVILSACNSAMGDGVEQGYVASLAEAFWIAGSRSVVASLWSVNDRSTALLMTQFYTRLKAGDSKAEALRQAQLAVRANPEFSHPFHWAGFVLYGDWR